MQRINNYLRNLAGREGEREILTGECEIKGGCYLFIVVFLFCFAAVCLSTFKG